MRSILIVARKEIQEGLRNRWVLATTLLLAALALTLTFLGSAPTGNVGADALDVAEGGDFEELGPPARVGAGVGDEVPDRFGTSLGVPAFEEVISGQAHYCGSPVLPACLS